MKSLAAGLAIALFALAGCASKKVVGPSVDGSGFLTIQTEQTEYSWSSDPQEWLGVNATIHNNSDRTFYASIGDRMYSSLDQELLYFGDNADATIEKRVTPESWAPVRTGPLIEGAGVIAIRPGQTYSLTGNLAPRSVGTHRIRLDFTDQPEIVPGRKTYREVSNSFAIR